MTRPDLSEIRDRLSEGVQKFDCVLSGVSAGVPQTLVTCYQQPTEAALLEVMAHPVKLRERKTSGGG